MTYPDALQGAGRGPWVLPKTMRRVLLLAPPLAFALLEIVHPQPDETVHALMDSSTWFAGFHVIQLALTGLVALSAFLLADSFGRANAWVTRLGLGVFLVFFSAYDAVAGIATGLAMRNARGLSLEQQQGVFEVVKDWPAAGAPFALSIVGTLGWVAAVGALALAARRQGAPRAEWVFIGLAAAFLLGGHPFPAGTLAFACFLSAALLREVRSATLHPQRLASNLAAGDGSNDRRR
jgi:hypothetical protein